MRKNYTYMALSCAALLAFGSCVEENFEQITPAQVGDEIVFGVRAGFEDSAPETRTEYGGKESEYVYGGKTYERINWVAGDMVEIYSPDAANNSQSFHYTVTKTTSDPQPGTNKPTVGEHLKDYASLTRYGDAGIQWGSAETHHFYAMYPSSVMWTGNPDPEVTVKSGAFMDYDNGSPIVHGIIPITQNPTKPIYESTSGNWVIPADMKYAYMVARGEATKEDASVELTFVPIVTAVEMELKLDEAGSNESVDAVNIDYVQIIGRGIAGDFTADLSDWPANGYPKCTNSDNGTDVITIDVRGAEQQTKTIQAGGSLTFTVFLRPGANVEDLNVSFFDGTRFLGKDLKGANIPMNLKTRIVDIRLPKNVSKLPIYSDKWMDRISGEVNIKALSLPGTGNSFSYAYKENDRKYFATQSTDMDINAQWNLGIRAFEIVSNRGNRSSSWGNVTYGNLGDENVECNKTNVGIKVRAALELIISKVRPEGTKEDDWTETAVVILTYQPHNQSRSRNAAYYAESLKLLYDEIAAKYADIFHLLTPTTKLDDVRGKILLVCRINQMHEGETSGNTGTNTSISQATANYTTAISTIGDRKILLINGCGTGKDKWGARGYTVNTNPNGSDNSVLPVLNMDCKINEVNTTDRTYSFVEQYMDNETEWKTYVNTPTWTKSPYTENEGNANFKYSTNQTGFDCWFHEWARVSIGGGDIGTSEYFRNSTENGDYDEANIYWFNSYNEKLANAAYTFNKSINDDTQSLIYINWLGGYFIDEGISGGFTRYYSDASHWGGDGGDVQGLANELNPDFMAIVENSGWENKTGPAGIVMIDYVGATPGAEKLPGTILMNNFRHDAAAGGGIIVTPPGSGDGFDDEIEE